MGVLQWGFHRDQALGRMLVNIFNNYLKVKFADIMKTGRMATNYKDVKAIQREQDILGKLGLPRQNTFKKPKRKIVRLRIRNAGHASRMRVFLLESSDSENMVEGSDGF